MFEKPNLPDEAIAACLRTEYGLMVAQIDFLPVGNDASAWAYKAGTGDGNAYFLKVRRGAVNEPAIAIPRYLRDNGIEEVVAPLSAADGRSWQRVGDYILILYPFIDGRPAMDVGMSHGQWTELGCVLRKIHTTGLTPSLERLVSTETFRPAWSPLVRELQAGVLGTEYRDPLEKELASFWRGRSNEIARLVGRAEALGRMLQEAPREFVLCHADIHTANILVTGDGGLHVVDWDGVLRAPKERDLMFIGGDEGDAGAVEAFYRGYGATEIDRLALAYYRYEWVVQELGDYGERVYLAKDTGEETKKDAVCGLMALFAAGDVVEAAYISDDWGE